MSPNISTLRDALFSTLSALQSNDDPMDIDRARAVCDVAREITSTAKIEIDFMRVSGNSSGSGFISVTEQAGNSRTTSGSRTVEQVTGGTVTTHRIR